MDISLDTGSNLTSLGFLWLILHYLLPVIIGIILIAIGFFALRYLLDELNISFPSQDITLLLSVSLITILIILGTL